MTDDPLTELQVTVAENTTLLREFIREQRTINGHFAKLHDATHNFIHGENGRAGAEVRLDRLEQFHGTQKWFIGGVSLSAIGLAIKSLWPWSS